MQSSEGRFENELIFYMVFEYMEQDLDHFIRQCPSPGMDESVVKVWCVCQCVNVNAMLLSGRKACSSRAISYLSCMLVGRKRYFIVVYST